MPSQHGESRAPSYCPGKGLRALLEGSLRNPHCPLSCPSLYCDCAFLSPARAEEGAPQATAGFCARPACRQGLLPEALWLSATCHDCSKASSPSALCCGSPHRSVLVAARQAPCWVSLEDWEALGRKGVELFCFFGGEGRVPGLIGSAL